MPPFPPTHRFRIKLDETGFGKLVLHGIHHLEMDMLRASHGHATAHAVVEDGMVQPSRTEVRVNGRPNDECEVDFHSHSPHEVAAVENSSSEYEQTATTDPAGAELHQPDLATVTGQVTAPASREVSPEESRAAWDIDEESPREAEFGRTGQDS